MCSASTLPEAQLVQYVNPALTDFDGEQDILAGRCQNTTAFPP
jgi:hypothetical protein